MEKFDMIRGRSMVQKLVVKDISWIWRDSWLKIRILVYHLRIVPQIYMELQFYVIIVLRKRLPFKLCFP